MSARPHGVHGIPEAVVLIGCVLIPLTVARGVSDPWVLPRLALSWVLLVICTASIGVVLALRATRIWYIRPCWSVDVPFGVTATLVVTSTMLSVDVHRSLVGDRGHYQGALTFLLYGASFLIARACLDEPESLRRLWTAIIAGSIPVAFYAVGQRLGFDPVWGNDITSDRVFATFGQPNALAAYLALCVPLSIGLTLDPAARYRALAIVAGVSSTIALLMTGSRGGLLGLVGGTVVLALTTIRHRRTGARPDERRVAAAVTVGVVTLGLVALAWSGGTATERDWIAPARDDGEASTDAHRDVWRVAAAIAMTDPLFGTGPDTFPDIFPTASHRVLTAERFDYLDQFRVESPHNLFLATAAGSGLPAMVGLAAFFAGSARMLLHVDRQRRGGDGTGCPPLRAAVGSLTAFLIAHQFMSTDLSSSWLIMLILGSGVGYASRDPLQVQPVKDS